MTEPGLAPRGDVLCGAWASVADLDERHRGKLSDEEWGPLLMWASEIMWALSGRVYAGVCEQTVTIPADDTPWCFNGFGPVGPGFDPAIPARPWYFRRPGRPDVVRLPGEPVIEVIEVLIDELVLDPTGYRLGLGGRLRRLGATWRTDGGTTIEYRFGVDPPEAGVQAAAELAYELARARSGDRGCRLPQRLTSISRQGVSVEVLDSLEILEKGRTGLVGPDMWLASVNPRHRSGRATVISPDLPRYAR